MSCYIEIKSDSKRNWYNINYKYAGSNKDILIVCLDFFSWYGCNVWVLIGMFVYLHILGIGFGSRYEGQGYGC